MVAPYSLDLRERVVAAFLAGEPCRSVAARFDIAESSVVKWAQRARTYGTPAPAQIGGYRKLLLKPHRAFILKRLVEQPDLTVRALLGELRKRGITVSRDTLWRFLKREGLSFKKNAVRERAIAARRREAQTALEEISRSG